MSLDNIFLAGMILLVLAGLVIIVLNYAAEEWDDDE